MQLAEAKAQFIANWGRFGSNWGINRTMAQIHALLLVSPDNLSADEVMEQLNISRGNANMNLRELMDWGLVQKVIVPGERKEFFNAEKDIWKVARQIVKERKKRELDLMIPVLKELSEVEGDKRDKAVKTFTDTIQNIRRFSEQADKTLDTMIKADEHWFWSSLIKLFGAKRD
ncbi:MAG TPA: MarR family transcriptional regulator [Puia sp.]|jgi:DNA-binding transcriptional regulator GbsR (MarR family)